jgi:hypothetical protein
MSRPFLQIAQGVRYVLFIVLFNFKIADWNLVCRVVVVVVVSDFTPLRWSWFGGHYPLEITTMYPMIAKLNTYVANRRASGLLSGGPVPRS